jgi:CheY-like chemotaxis protein
VGVGTVAKGRGGKASLPPRDSSTPRLLTLRLVLPRPAVLQLHSLETPLRPTARWLDLQTGNQTFLRQLWAGFGGASLPSEKRETVLLVEDEALIRMGMAEVLESAGYVVREAGDGIAALSILASNPDIALLVTDIDLPRMDGLQLVEAARSTRPDLCVILMSGKTYLRTGRLPDTIPFLEKPVSETDLVACVRAELSREGGA